MSGRQSYKTRWQNRLKKSGLGVGPVCVGLVMSTHAKADGRDVFPSARDMAEGIGADRKTVSKHRKTLEDGGWLAQVGTYKRQVNGKVYRLTLPEDLAQWRHGAGRVRSDGAPF